MSQLIDVATARDVVLAAVRPLGAELRDGRNVLTSMVGAGALAMVPAGEGALPAGARVEAELLADGA